MTKDEALKDLLDAVEAAIKANDWVVDGACDPDLAIRRAKQAMAQPEQEPVAWRFQSAVGGWAYGKEPPIGSKYAVEPLYTTPPQRTWVGLTRKEAEDVVDDYITIGGDVENWVGYWQAIEAKLKEKNT